MVSLSPTVRSIFAFFKRDAEGWREQGRKDAKSRDPENSQISNSKSQISNLNS